jgi:MFS family permease
MTSFRTLARNHDFTVLWIGQTISELGSRVSTFVFPLLAYLLTESALASAVTEAAYLLGLAGMLLPAGVLADRFHRLRIMRLSSGLGVVLYSSLVVAGALGVLTIAHLVVVALLSGIVAGLFSPAEASAIRTVVPADELPTALSQQQARQHVANLLGAPLGGALLGLSRFLPFVFDAVSYAVAWVLLGRIRTDLSPAERPASDAPSGVPSRPWHDLRAGLSFTWSHTYLRVVLCWAPLVNLTLNALFFVALLRLIQGGTPPTMIAFVEVFSGACGILGAVLAPRIIDRFPTGRLGIAIAWSMVPVCVPLALWSTPLVMAVAAAWILLPNPAGNAAMSSYRMAITPPELIGRVQSASQFVSMITMPLFPVVAGALLGWLGGRDAILALGALTALCAFIPTLSASVRSVPRPSEWVTTEQTEAAQLASA